MTGPLSGSDSVRDPVRDVERRLAAIAARDGAIGAFARLWPDGARSAARDSAARMAAGTARALEGMVLAVKENIAVAGAPTRAGLALPAPEAEADAEATVRLRAAGAVLLGAGAMDEAAFGGMTDNPHFGRVLNPHPAARGRSAGGSSGGSAAAVAAGFAEAALGTDTLGSVRIPASYCGLVGFKPSPGRVSARGVRALAPSLDTLGVLAGDVETAARVFAVLDHDDPAWPLARPGRAQGPFPPERLAVPSSLARVALAPEVAAGFAEARARLGEAGFVVEEVDTAPWRPDAVRKAALLLLEAEAAEEFAEPLADPDSALSAPLRAMLAYGRDCGASRLVRALAAIHAAAAAAEAAMVRGRAAALLLPTTPETAPAFDAVPAEQASLTALANIAGLPALSLPVPGAGAPVGLQLVGHAGADGALLDLGARAAAVIAP